MTKYLIIAGHGQQANGRYDTGARNLISKGEHRYFKEDFFPHMKKYLPEQVNVVFHTEWNVYSYRNNPKKNLTGLVKKHNADVVIEYHFDSFDSNARGGHVIVWHEFKADELDRRLKEGIGRHVPLRLSHRGERGISGRNLENARQSAKGGINYRLMELGNSNNKRDVDIMVNDVDEYAKDQVFAIFGSIKDDGKVEKPKDNKKSQSKPKKKTIKQMAKEVYQGKHGDGEQKRRASLGVDKQTYEKVQRYVNQHYYGIKSAPKKQVVTQTHIDTLAKRAYLGGFGNGSERKKNLGNLYDRVQKRVNELYF